MTDRPGGTANPKLLPDGDASSVRSSGNAYKFDAVESDPKKAFSAQLRAFIHFSAIGFAFPLTTLAATTEVAYGWAWAAFCCVVATLINVLILPHTEVASFIRKPNEGWLSGIWLYPLCLGVSFAIFPAYAVGAAWAVLATGDAAASVLGRAYRQYRLPWNPQKSWIGFGAFLLSSIPAAWLLLIWMPPAYLMSGSVLEHLDLLLALAVVAALTGSIVESLDVPVDDNIRLTFGVSLAVWLCVEVMHLGSSLMPPERGYLWQSLLHALGVNVLLAAVVKWVRFTDFAGAAAGGAIGSAVYFLALPSGYMLLLFFVIGGSLLSRIGRGEKEKRGVAEARDGRRGIENVVANLAIPGLCVLFYPVSQGHPAWLLAFAGAIAAALADTASSEIGALSRKKPLMITTWKEVAHGTDGAISWLGMCGSFGACLMLAMLAWLMGFWAIIVHGHFYEGNVLFTSGLVLTLTVVLAGLLGTTVDSYLGATIENRIKGIGKGVVNFLCTLSGALFAGLCGWIYL